MDNKKIFLANLSKGKIGEDVSEMLGSLLVSKFQLDVMSRASIQTRKENHFGSMSMNFRTLQLIVFQIYFQKLVNTVSGSS
jgi:hypothetical protein